MERALRYVEESDADIFCLQEVPESALARLSSLPYHSASAPEFDRIERGETITTYLVTLSRYPIAASKAIPLRTAEPRNRINRAFVAFMVRIRLWGRIAGNRHALSTDVETPQGIVRVFNLHPALFPPHERIEEFMQNMEHRDMEMPVIVCGDFNILESPHIAPFNWLLGGTPSDAVRYARERRRMENEFARLALSNPLRGKITHRISRSQLDHILVSHDFDIVEARVASNPVGSDHLPIMVECEVHPHLTA